MEVCKMCGRQVEKLVRCHIYPNAITKAVLAEEHSISTMSIADGPRTSSGHAGFLDPNIVCARCEALFGRADEYAVHFRKKVLILEPPYQALSSEIFLFRARSDLLHTFAMQTVLRASLSQRPENRLIDATEFHNEIISHLINGESTIKMGTEVCIWVTRGEFKSYSAAPAIASFSEKDVWRISPPGMHLFVAMSSEGLPKALSHSKLTPAEDVIVRRRRNPDREEMQAIEELLIPNMESVAKISKSALKRAGSMMPHDWLAYGTLKNK